MASSIFYRLIPALSVVAYGLAYEGEMLTWEAARGTGVSWSSVQNMHVALVVLATFLIWRTVLWYRRQEPFAYKWMLFLLPLLGLQLLDWLWGHVTLSLWREWRQSVSDDEASQLLSVTFAAGRGCVPLMVVVLAQLSSQRAGMARRINLVETVCVVVQTCITLGTLSSALVQVTLAIHVIRLGDALLSALRIAYLGKLLRQHFVSEAQLFGLGAVQLIDPVRMVIDAIRWPRPSHYTHDWLAEQHLFLELCILLINVLQTWILPTVVLINMGSVAAAELETLIPSFYGVRWGRFVHAAKTDPSEASWDDSYKVYDGINLLLALTVLVSAVRTRWLRDTAALQQKTSEARSRATADEQVELVA